MNIVSKSSWKKYWGAHKAKKIGFILFEDLFKKYLKPDSSLSCIEIGCVP